VNQDRGDTDFSALRTPRSAKRSRPSRIKRGSSSTSIEWKASVIYGEGQDPYPTSPEDVIGWLREHYREHVEQSADLIEEWAAAHGS